MEDRTGALGEIAWDVLQRIVRDRLARKPGGHLIEATLDAIDLDIAIPLRGEAASPETFSRSLVEAIDGLLDDAIQQAASFRPGHAFCHRCGNALCKHAEPPSARHVFVGYAPTGTPRWVDFAQLCLDIRHPDVDRLYDDPPAFLTLVHDASFLHGNLVDAFQAVGYDLIGQVTAGFFRVRMREGEGRGVVAVTFQAAASRPRSGRLRLGLNILGRTPGGEPLEFLWDRHEEIPWRAAVRWAQAALAAVSRRGGRAGRGRGDLRERVDGILRGLARRLERDQRARHRRTQHAEERHVSGSRPTRKAVEDTRRAKEETILVDERNGTLVVAGDRGRTHFFSPEGRLVSSVRYNREAIERKRKLGLWRDARPAEAAALREKLEAPEPRR